MKMNFKVMALAGVAAAVAIGGTFAYYTATNTFKNEFNTENFGTSSVEIFNPGDGDNWEPGVNVKKAVYGQNTGEGDVYVRVFFDEEWTRDGVVLTSLNSKDTQFRASVESVQENNEDGDIGMMGKESVVLKDLTYTHEPVKADSAEAGQWYLGNDGWFYYTAVLKQGDVTNTLLDSVTLASNTDMGKYADFAKFRKIPKAAEGTTDQELLKKYKPELKFVNGELEAVPENSFQTSQGDQSFEASVTEWFDMDVDSDGYYFIPTNDDQNPVNIKNNRAVIAYNKDTETFFSYEEHKMDPDHKGYADADYNLKIRIEYIQADKDHAAVDAQAGENAWEWYPGKETEDEATP